MRKIVLDLEFLGHRDDAVILAAALVEVPKLDERDKIQALFSEGAEGFVDYYAAQLDVNEQEWWGRTSDKETREWWDKHYHIKEAIDSDKRIHQNVHLDVFFPEFKDFTGIDFVLFERTPDADVPKLQSLARDHRGAVPYWARMETKSYLAGAGVESITHLLSNDLTIHNPLDDAIMDARRIVIADWIKSANPHTMDADKLRKLACLPEEMQDIITDMYSTGGR